jgi:hypothetical protein
MNIGPNATPYWRRVYAVWEQLPREEWFHIASIDHPAAVPHDWRSGVVCIVSREDAARRISEGTHKLASEAEKDAYLVERAASESACAAAERLRVKEQDFGLSKIVQEVLNRGQY